MATAVHKKQSESKYVTCFADSRPDVDITFRDVLLARPTDHYLVGIDNFSMTNTSLSMIEPMTGNSSALMRIVQRLKPAGTVTTAQASAEALQTVFESTGQSGDRKLSEIYVTPASLNNAGYNLSIPSSEVILSIQQLMNRLTQLAADVNRLMNSGLLKANTDFEYDGYDPEGDAGKEYEHLKFEVATDGHLEITGTAAFWSCFCIEVPAVQNQFGFFGERSPQDKVDFTRLRRFLSVDPSRGPDHQSYATIQVLRKPVEGQENFSLEGNDARVLSVATAITGNATEFNKESGAIAKVPYTIKTRASIFSSLERRVALEVGCSLPIKNSPMVDHQKESPDFVLGRWIWRTDPRIESSKTGQQRRYSAMMPACTEYQGAQDRITYHELQPQAKIQTLRIKLFARLRTFKEVDETYAMRIIELPTSKTDWWHARIHFMSKDN